MVLVSSSELSGAPLLFAVLKVLRSPQNGYRFAQVAQSESFTVPTRSLVLDVTDKTMEML